MVDWWWLIIAVACGFLLGMATMAAFISGSIHDEKAGIKDA